VNATVTDERRRLVMPPELPARSPVTVQQIDEDTWLVKRQKPEKPYLVYLLPDVKHHEPDPEWEATERKLAGHLNKNVPPFEE